jgi:hypothetical protein
MYFFKRLVFRLGYSSVIEQVLSMDEDVGSVLKKGEEVDVL